MYEFHIVQCLLYSVLRIIYIAWIRDFHNVYPCMSCLKIFYFPPESIKIVVVASFFIFDSSVRLFIQWWDHGLVMDYTYVGMVQKIRNSRYYFPICLIRMIHNIYILLLSPMCVCAVCHCNSPYYHLTECCVRHVYTKLYLIRQDEDNDPSFLPRFSPESHKYIHIHRLTSIFSIFWLLRTGTSRIELSCIFGVWCIWRRITMSDTIYLISSEIFSK